MFVRTLSLISLAVLLVLELVLRYDTTQRQIALSLTNVLGVVLYFGVVRFFSRRQVTLPDWLWVLVAVGIWFDAIGNFVHLYARFDWWDQLVHFTGPALIGLIVMYLFKAFKAKGLINLPPQWHHVVVISVAMLITVLYEISEYIGDILFHTNRIPALYDTADDLWWGLVAITLVTLVGGRQPGKNR